MMKEHDVLSCNYDEKRKGYRCTMLDGSVWESPDGKDWSQVEEPVLPKTGSKAQPALAKESPISTDIVSAMLLADQMSKSPWGDLPPTQQKIHEIMGAMKDLLLYKNQKYGDSALNPIGIFTKHLKTVDEKTASILVRIDDKLSRVKNADTLRKNDICDLIGYLTLLNIAIGTTAEDIEKFKD